MKYNYLKHFIVMLLLFGLVAGCSKDNPSEPKEEAPQFVPKTVAVPEAMQNSSDPMAQMAMSYIGSANMITNFSAFFTPPGLMKTSANLGSTGWERKWEQDGITITLTATENDTGYQWSVKLDGTSQSTGETYNNFIFLKIEQNKDGTAGRFSMFDPEEDASSGLIMEWVWSTLPGDVLDVIRTFYDDGIPAGRIKVLSNPDKSGELYFYDYVNGNFVMEFKATWTSSGTGEWWSYDSMGNVDSHGSWG